MLTHRCQIQVFSLMMEVANHQGILINIVINAMLSLDYTDFSVLLPLAIFALYERSS